MREGARKWKGPNQKESVVSSRAGLAGLASKLTTAGRVESGHLAEVGVVLDCCANVSKVLESMQISETVDVRFERKNSPEMLRASQRTTTTFWPLRSCLATTEARRPRRWPLPSTTTCNNAKQLAVLFCHGLTLGSAAPGATRVHVHIDTPSSLPTKKASSSRCTTASE